MTNIKTVLKERQSAYDEIQVLADQMSWKELDQKAEDIEEKDRLERDERLVVERQEATYVQHLQ